jgi:leucyl aminopeptidase
VLDCFVVESNQPLVHIECVNKDSFDAWLESQSSSCQNWLRLHNFEFAEGEVVKIPNAEGGLAAVLLCIADDFWTFGKLPAALPAGCYQLTESNLSVEKMQYFCMAWGLAHYKFSRYKKQKKFPALLNLPQSIDAKLLDDSLQSIYLVRDLINMPANDLGPTELSAEAKKIAKAFKANINIIAGDNLLKENYPAVHAVGKASTNPPHLIDFSWGNAKHPKITLVGKGVCFDSGGLDLKSASGMLEMKKDMGGSAHVLGLARLIMAQNLPVRLRVLIPTVENSVAGNSYRPGDVLQTRAGLTVEIGNTDAEGRLILCDALAEASAESPDCIVDFATLTGAARIALGTELPAFFTNNDELAQLLAQCADQVADPIWRMPLYQPYNDLLKSDIADLNNISSSVYGGSITAALYLQRFVSNDTPWIHFDLMASNTRDLPGRPKGGEATGLRAAFEFIKQKYC